MFFEATYLVDSRDADPQGQCRPSSLLGYLQEAATQAAVELHVDRDKTVGQYNAFWMMARIWYRLFQPLRWAENVTVRTWHRGDRGASMYRDYDLFRNGEHIGEGVSVWVLADVDTHKLLRLSNVPEVQNSSGGELCKSMILNKLRIPCELTLSGERKLHYSDTDINGHVNNVRYADFACDALHMQRLGAGRFVSELQISYLKECLPGETIRLSTGCAEGKWYVSGAGGEGGARFDAALGLTPLDNMGAGA